MVRNSCFILGIALGIFWWVGLSRNAGATVLWFDAVAAVLAFGTAALVSEPEHNPSRLGGPVVIGLGLAVLWIVGMSVGQPPWANWLNFVFAMSFLGVAVAAALQPRMVHVPRQSRVTR
jgi:hypothetical protein